MLSCDKQLHPETWNPPGPQENFFATPRATFESSQILYQGTHPLMEPNAAGEASAFISTWRLAPREAERMGSTIPTPTFARRPPTMRFFILVNVPHSSMVERQRQQISELQFDKILIPTFFLLEDNIQKPVDCLLWLSFGSHVMDQRGGDGLFNEWIEVISISCGQEFP